MIFTFTKVAPRFKSIAIYSMLVSSYCANAASAVPEQLSVSLDQDTIHWLQMHHSSLLEPSFASPLSIQIPDTNEKLSIVQIKSENIVELSEIMHHKFHRCGGFMVEESPSEFIIDWGHRFTDTETKINYRIQQQEVVKRFISQVEPDHIKNTIKYLSQFENRYYRSQTGIDSQKSVKGIWEKLTLHNPNISVELVDHSPRYPQPSVKLTWLGRKYPEEIVAIGGHGDSIAFNIWGGVEKEAPGADDNASGIATITEVLSILAASDWQPERTIEMFSYAAEEVGLKGSNEIARSHRENRQNVIGVLQYDMTGHPSNPNEIGLVSDYTSKLQNQFIKELVKTYLPQLKVLEDRCGYACSDHASWYRQGYRASTPFETSPKSVYNKIHSRQDTLENLNNSGEHAAKFARLAIAYLVEMAVKSE